MEKKKGKKFTYSITKIFAWRARRAVKRKIKCLQGLCGVLKREITSFLLFSVVSLLLLEKKKNTALKYACVNYAGRWYPTPELEVQLPIQRTATRHCDLGRHRLCYVAPLEGQCSLLLWSKKIPLLT